MPTLDLVQIVVNRGQHEPATDAHRWLDKHPVHNILEFDNERADAVPDENVQINVVELFGEEMLQDACWIATFDLLILIILIKFK